MGPRLVRLAANTRPPDPRLPPRRTNRARLLLTPVAPVTRPRAAPLGSGDLRVDSPSLHRRRLERREDPLDMLARDINKGVGVENINRANRPTRNLRFTGDCANDILRP